MIDSDPVQCSKCGEPHRRCTAHNRRGTPCMQMRMKGQTVCKMHGGLAPQNRKAGVRRAELAKAIADSEALLAHQEGEGITDPLTVLAKLAEEALALKNALAARVNALTSLRYEDDKGSEQLRSEVILYERALDRSAKFVELLAKSGFEEARVKLQIQQGQLVAHVLKRIMDQLELSPQQQVIAGQVIPNELRRLGGEKDPS